MFFIRRLWNWCKRFRYRCGYGVHSPSDFFLITSVIYETLPYYAYRELEKTGKGKITPRYRKKVNRLLFRLVNYYRPDFLIHVGEGKDEAFRYMCAARTSMKTFDVSEGHREGALLALNKIMKERQSVDFLHVGQTPYYREVMEKMLPYMGKDSCLVVGGIYASKEKEAWWTMLKADERVRVTFDLYDVGILLFDPKRYKQDYIVNFF